VLLCTARIRASGAVVTVHGAGSQRVLARHSEIAQVIVNLLSNACDAVEGKAERAIRIELSEASEGQVRVRIVDAGTPPPPRTARAMFDAFFTTKADGHGLGLGLSISRQILRELGGELTFDASAPTTTFVVSLRAALERDAEQVEAALPRSVEPPSPV
jgi:two-component system C4-dicarboxylate transport sensor histidine kinase DctB